MDNQTHNIICISTIDWDFIWQGHQEIMSSLARAGNRVLFVENTGVRTPTLRDLPRIRRRFSNWRNGVKGIRQVMDNLYVYSPSRRFASCQSLHDVVGLYTTTQGIAGKRVTCCGAGLLR